MLADQGNGLLSSSFCSLILDNSFGLSGGIQALDIWFQKTWVRILHSAKKDNLSPFDSKSLTCRQCIKINTNKQANMYVCTYVRTCVHTTSIIHVWQRRSWLLQSTSIQPPRHPAPGQDFILTSKAACVCSQQGPTSCNKIIVSSTFHQIQNNFSNWNVLYAVLFEKQIY